MYNIYIKGIFALLTTALFYIVSGITMILLVSYLIKNVKEIVEELR